MRSKLLNILLIILTFCIASFFIFEICSYASNSFALNLTPLPTENSNRGAVNLDWSSYPGENVIFKGYQSKQGGAEDSWTSISLMDYSVVKKVKVLQVYPDKGAGQLTKWMEQDNDNGEVYGKGIIDVSEVSISEFNTNPQQYLKKDDQGQWNYDVIFFGTADRNGQRDLSAKSYEVVNQFINDGYGCIFGHDTLLNNSAFVKDTYEVTGGSVKQGQEYFDKLAKEHFKSLKFGSIQGNQLYHGGNKVKIVKNGLFTTYPWSIGEIGTVLNIPTTHTWGQVVNSGYEDNIWLRFDGMEEEGYNFYLLTENNVSLIQTGHSGGSATPDEEKIIANLIFSSYQISSNTSTIDRSAMDYAAPTLPTLSIQENNGNVNINFSSEDVGTNYTYKVEAYDKLNYNTPIATSDTPTTTVTSGFDKYYYIIDDKPENDFDIDDATPIQEGRLQGSYQTYAKKYIHIKAVDKAGNTSKVKTQQIKDTTPPVLNVTPGSCDWKKEQTVNLKATDQGGSGFKEYTYAITNSSDPASEGWSQPVANSEGNIEIKTEGEVYLHVKGVDNEENSTEDIHFGPYKIDNSKPTVTVSGDFETKTTEPIDITINSHDNYSGLKEIRFNSQSYQPNEELSLQIVTNGTYRLEVEDVAGNIFVKDILVENIYRNCEANLDHPIYATDKDRCPICEAIEGIKIREESKNTIYNATEKHIMYENPNSKTIKEYYNDELQVPIEVGSYQYELKIVYEGEEYKTGLKGVITISQKQITIEDVTAVNREYNGLTEVQLQGGKLIGVEETDKGNVDFALPEKGLIQNKNVGNYYVTIMAITLSGDKAKNYNLIQPTNEEVRVEISKKDITIENIAAQDREYDGTIDVKISGGNLVGIEEVDEGKVEFSLPETGTIPKKDVGKYYVTIPEITLSGEEAGNYNLIQPGGNEVQVNITKKTMQNGQVRIENIIPQDRQYDGTKVVELKGGEITGLEESDIGKVGFILPPTGTIESKDVGTYNVTIPEITLTGEEAKNYQLTQPTNDEVKVEITQKEITIQNITAINRKYNGTTNVEIQGGELVGIEQIDVESVDFTLPQIGTIPSKNIGEYGVTIPTIVLTGNEAKNYNLIQPTNEEVRVEISKKEITIENIVAQDREYDGTTDIKISGGNLVGIEEVDEGKVEFSLPETGTVESKNVGEYNVTILTIVLTGIESDNYELLQPNEEIKATITKRTLTVEYVKGKDRKYDKTNEIEIIHGELQNVIEGENVTLVVPEKGVSESSNTGTWKVQIEELVLEGKDIENYDLIQPNPEDVTVTISKPDQPKLHIEPYISKLNDEKLTETIPIAKFTEDSEGKNTEINYKKQDLKEKIRYADKLTITIRIYNEGTGSGYAHKITNIIPKGLEFDKNSETNKTYKWEKKKDNTVVTSYLGYESGIDNEISPRGEKIDYREVSLELEVIEKENIKNKLRNKSLVEAVDIENMPATENVIEDNTRGNYYEKINN